jgi:hypothetical protein
MIKRLMIYHSKSAVALQATNTEVAWRLFLHIFGEQTPIFLGHSYRLDSVPVFTLARLAD